MRQKHENSQSDGSHGYDHGNRNPRFQRFGWLAFTAAESGQILAQLAQPTQALSSVQQAGR